MNRKAIRIFAAAASALLGLFSAGPAVAQAPPTVNLGDWPNLGSYHNRTNQNGDPTNQGSGRTELRWGVPFSIGSLTVITLDNTSFADTRNQTLFPGGPYDRNIYGLASTPFPNLAAWSQPASTDKEANGAFIPLRRLSNIGTLPLDRTPRSPSYYFTNCTPMAAGQSDPTVAEDPTKRKYFEWVYTPREEGSERTYALYTHLPIGATNVAAGTGVDRRFQQRYLVYEIRFGNGLRIVDVVDTSASGNGWVRLGGGGNLTEAVFPYIQAGQPIRVRIYNTVPRDSDGILRIDGATENMTVGQEETLAQRYLVYADGSQARPTRGTFVASPTAATWTPAGGTLAIDWQVTLAGNQFVPGISGGVYSQSSKGVVRTYQANPDRWDAQTVPKSLWTFSPLEESENGNTVDNNSAGVTYTPLFTPSTVNTKRIGDDYLTADCTTGTTATATVTYSPTLGDGNYDIYAYIGGNLATDVYARGVVYEIYEGTTLAYTGVLNQSLASGWVRLGTRRYLNTVDTLPNEPIRVVITNRTTNAGDVGRKVYADAIRFVSTATLTVRSTPVHAEVFIRQADGSLPATKTKVVIVADETGRIHCLDFRGNNDGTTTEYWSYPSTPVLNSTWYDPNLSPLPADGGNGTRGIDGTIDSSITPPRLNQPTAEMPASFDLSTALIAEVNGRDVLYVGASNGRVYAIDMSGRGDYNATSRRIGTTQRLWSFPDDYPSVAQTSALGAFRGSLVYRETTNGPTIFAPARQGRIYALNAEGNSTTRTTSVRWQYPSSTSSTLPSILMTPTLDDSGRLFFGTERDLDNDGPGEFYALNSNDGTLLWKFDGTATGSQTVTESVGAFKSAPVAVSAARLNEVPSPYAVNPVDTVYVLNENLYFYGFNAATGQLVTSGGRTLHSSATNVLADTSLTYTVINTFGRDGLRRQFPVIIIPGTDGRLLGVAARVEDYDLNGSFILYGASFRSGLRSVAASNQYLFASDQEGFFYALDNIGAAAGNLPVDGSLPGVVPIITPNDPRGRPFRNLKIKLMNKAGFLRLREINADGTGGLTYNEAVNDSSYHAANPPSGQNFAFEWGQTAYIMVYGFPYATRNLDDEEVAPPQVNITISVEGKVARQLQVDSRQFRNPASAPNVDEPAGSSLRQDAYAALSFTFQGGGPNSLPPGNGNITASVTTASLSNDTAQVEIIGNTANSSVPFIMANPLALIVYDYAASATNPINGYGIGYAASPFAAFDPYNPGNSVNGSPNVSGSESLFMASAGYGQNGAMATAKFGVIDRSLMALIRPEGRGIENLRVQRSNLQWQGGANSIFRRLLPGLYPNMEDAPANFPNTSLDYPNIGREQVRVVKDPGGAAENPLLSTVNLLPPLSITNTALTEDNLGANNARLTRITPFDVQIDIPRYQPPVNVGVLPTSTDSSNLLSQRPNSAGTVLAQGYIGRIFAFVDSSGDGRLSADTREAYRALNTAVGVLPQYAIQLGTPTVDLGSLAAGTGYSTLNPSLDPNGPYNPWTGTWNGAYKSFVVRNDGNVNLLDLRLAKAYTNPTTGSGLFPWEIPSADNDPLAYLGATGLNGGGNLEAGALWSNIDTTFAVPISTTNSNRVILPKPRVTDRLPTELVANPSPRANANLGTSGTLGRLNPTRPQSAPKVGISVPVGFPVGNYTGQFRVIEDEFEVMGAGIFGTPDNQTFNFNLGGAAGTSEAYSDLLTVSFKVRESRLTNNATARTQAMIDGPIAANAAGQSYRNAAPTGMRDRFGSLIVAWESDRPAADAPSPAAPLSTRIYLASLDNAATFANAGVSAPAGNIPLWDLTQFQAFSPTQWFKKANATGFPAGQGSVYFGAGTVESTVRFGSPALPAAGSMNPLSTLPFDLGQTFNSTYMAFVGEAQVDSGTGRLSQSQIFATTLSSNQAGDLTTGAIIPTLDDPQTAKGKPSVLQLPSGALVFYPATSAGQTSINMSRVQGSGTFASPVRLNFGSGFSTVTSPSATARQSALNGPVVELSFAGKLRGRPNQEVFLSRLQLDPTGTFLMDAQSRNVETAGSGTPFVNLPQQSDERLTNEGSGTFRARGVYWRREENQIGLTQVINGGAQQSLLIAGTRKVDPQTGIIAYESRLGGRVYLDPELGSVRFAGGTPIPTATIYLTYTPAFLRITSGGAAGYSAVNGLFDGRYVSEYSYWFSSGTATGFGNINGTAGAKNDRFVFSYGRGAAGNGLTARPYSTTLRFGIQLPSRIATGTNGNVLGVTVSGATQPYQVDPANGRIYFQAADEGRQIDVSYTGVNEADNTPIGVGTRRYVVTYITERAETPIAIEETANESDLSVFLDPFSYSSGPGNNRERPSLIWLFYVSTRAGAPDLYFQSIAPRFAPFPR